MPPKTAILPDQPLVRHWMLSLAVEHPVWLGLVFPVVDEMALNVRAIPSFTDTDCVECLMNLMSLGLIRISASGVPVETDEALRRELGEVVLAHSSPRLLPDASKQTCFELTPSGGEAWTQLAKPDWSRVVIGHSDSHSGELMAANKDVLMAYMGWYPEIQEDLILWDTVRMRTLADYPILYWKPLPLVYCASFEVKPSETRSRGAAPAWFREWWMALASWHRKPWDLPGWPVENRSV